MLGSWTVPKMNTMSEEVIMVNNQELDLVMSVPTLMVLTVVVSTCDYSGHEYVTGVEMLVTLQ